MITVAFRAGLGARFGSLGGVDGRGGSSPLGSTKERRLLMCRATTGDRPRKQSRLSQIHRSSSATPRRGFRAKPRGDPRVVDPGARERARRSRRGSNPCRSTVAWCNDTLDAVVKEQRTRHRGYGGGVRIGIAVGERRRPQTDARRRLQVRVLPASPEVLWQQMK